MIERPPVLSGRAREIAEIDSLLHSLGRGRGRALMFSGEPGIGKTFVIEYAAVLAEQSGYSVAMGACFEDSSHIALMPFRDIVRNILDVYSSDYTAEAFAADSALHSLVPDRVPFAVDEPEPPEVDRLERLFDAVSLLLRRAASRRPIIVTIDDLQWADETTMKLLRRLTRSTASMPVSIIGSFRDTEVEIDGHVEQYVQDLQRERTGTHVALRRLFPDETLAACSVRLGAPTTLVPDALVELVHRESEGVPLFVDEWLAYLQEEGYLRKLADAGWSFGPARSLSAPHVVKRVIQRRLTRLEAETIRILECLAVAGSAARYPGFRSVIADVVGISQPRVEHSVAEALRRQILVRRESDGESASGGTLAFAHEQFKRAVLDNVVESTRRDLHQSIAQSIEAAPHGFEDLPAILAYHYSRGHDSHRAFQFTLQAAEAALRIAALGEATRHFEGALEILDTSTTGDDSDCARSDDRTRILRALDDLCYERQDHTRQVDILRLLRLQTRLCGDASDRFELALRQARFGVAVSDIAAAKEFAQAALVLAGDDPERQLKSLIAVGESWTGRPVGEPSPLLDNGADLIKAEQAFARARSIAHTLGDRERVASLDQELGVVTWGVAKPTDTEREEASRDFLLRALDGYRAVGNRNGEVTALIALAYRRRTETSGDSESHVDSYVSFLEEIRRLRATEHGLTRSSDHPRSEALALLSIHLFCRTNGWYEIAIDRASRALEWAIEARDERIALIARTGLSETERLAGRGARSLEHAEAAMAALEHRRVDEGSLAGLRDTVLDALSAAHAAVGVGEQAIRFARLREREAKASSQASSIAGSLASLAEVYAVLGNTREAHRSAEEALQWSAQLAGNITCDIRAELVLARLALRAGDARLALGYSTAATGKLAQRETPLVWLRTEAHLTRGLALELSDHIDDARDAVSTALTLVIRTANRISNSALREAYLSRASSSIATLAAADRLGISREIVDRRIPAVKPGGLTAREIEVLRLVASGLPNREIADRLYISEKTVARHLTNTFNKIDAQSRTQAAAWAYRNGIV